MKHEEKLKLLTLPAITALIHRQNSTLRRDIKEGRLKVVHVGRQLRVTPASLRAFLTAQDRKKKAG